MSTSTWNDRYRHLYVNMTASDLFVYYYGCDIYTMHMHAQGVK